MEISVQMIGISMLRYIPEILAWLFGVVLAVLMVRRGESKTEKLLLAGCCLMFLARLITPVLWVLVQSLVSGQDAGYLTSLQALGWTNIPVTILGLAGFVCLVWAFWVRFRVKRQASA